MEKLANNCRKCPHFREGIEYINEQGKAVYDTFCKKAFHKKIQDNVRWAEKVIVPEWCPIKDKEK
jgi:hypothetical protein